MSTFSLTPLEFNPSSPRVVSYMNLMVLVQKTRCDIHGKPLWRRRLETTVKYWIRQRLLWRSVHWAVGKALGFRITFKMVQVYQICNHAICCSRLYCQKDSEGWKWDRKSEDPIDTHKLRLFAKYAAKLWLFAPNPFLPTKWWEKEFAQRVVRLSIYKFSSWNKRQHTVWETGNERHFLQRSGFRYSKGTRVQLALLTFVAILDGQEESSIERRETKPRWRTKTFCVSSACNPNNLWGRNETNELPLCVVVIVPHPREEDSVYPSKSSEEKGMTTAKERHPQHHQDMKE